jgi:hypothetical protein
MPADTGCVAAGLEAVSNAPDINVNNQSNRRIAYTPL